MPRKHIGAMIIGLAVTMTSYAGDERTPLQEQLLAMMPVMLKVGVVIVICALLGSQFLPLFTKGKQSDANESNGFKRFVQFGFGGIGSLMALWFFYNLAR